ncbi:bifunctional alpha/beta hydrolase/OsmC family protein [Pontivivens insulae]|uniref:Serine aminopeptidase S33 domain-containing protein n=1 Tax=Pontivivens insulae TaxID=1639689 RepID=A0A2R8AB91_9RHOB|nr:bifunctional alpha/beta hydrolase/OsmC family protein [Pontivivens insulae]RED11346.1 putative redox protein [Pontivivens insulae]SPF29481.1 hypothetical protein POI8812_01792 [Pontivivens insulae]
MKTEQITFKGHSGEPLAARLDLPEGPHLATALFAHCFTCSKDIPAARRIAARLAQAGIAVMRFDFTGLGHSAGEFENTHFTSNVADLHLAAKALAERDMAPSLLIGHSLGGAAVLAAAGDIESVKAVATIGAPSDPAHVAHNFKSEIESIERNGQAKVSLGGRPFTIKRGFLDDIRANKLEPRLAKLKRALLVLHAPGDDIVGIDNASKIWLAAKHPKSFVTLDTADHLLTRASDAEYAAEVIASWAGRYLDLKTPAAPIGAPEGVTRVSEADPTGFLQDVNAGPKHHTLADEPLSYGGTDQGLTPYQFLAAGLGACTSMTIRMYARKKGWPLSHVSVDVTHDKVHASDCETCLMQEGRIDHLHRAIRLEGDLDDAQRARLLEIADKCPVHKTLESGAHVTTVLAA